MEQSSSREANISAISLEIPCILWNFKCCYLVYYNNNNNPPNVRPYPEPDYSIPRHLPTLSFHFPF